MRGSCLKPLVAGLAVLGLAGPALAQDQVLAACRTEMQSVALEMTFSAGACIEPGDAWAGDPVDGVAPVTVATTALDQFCTTQLVPVHFNHTVIVDPAATSLTVTVLSPDNTTLLSGAAAIAPHCAGAPAPVAE